MSNSKEFTLFLVDLSPSMGLKHQGRSITDLDYGLEYLYNYTTDLLLKNRKSDRIALALHNGGTKQDFELLYDDSQFTYQSLRDFAQKLKVGRNIIDNNDLMTSVCRALDQFKEKIHLKFSRQVVIISNLDSSSLNSMQQLDDYAKMISDYNIKISLSGIDFDTRFEKSPIKKNNERDWIKLQQRIPNITIRDTSLLSVKSSNKRIAPRASFAGDLKFADDIQDPLNDLESTNSSSLNLQVQAFPAVRPESIPNSHDYLVSDNDHKTTMVKRRTTYYIKNFRGTGDEDDDEPNSLDESETSLYDKVEIGEQHIPGFKFSHLDTIGLNGDLKEMTKLISNASIDIIGFIKSRNFPIAYFTDESSYIIPSSDSTYSNVVAFNSLVKTVVEMKSLIIARCVFVSGKEITLCALIPKVIEISDSRIIYSFIAIRIAFKEDEKKGRFPSLTKTDKLDMFDTNDSSKDLNNLPSNDINSEMEAFIKANTLKEETNIDMNRIQNKKVSNVDQLSHARISTTTKLIIESPAINKYSYYLRKIIKGSLYEASLHDYLHKEDFVQKYLASSNHHDIFNLNEFVEENNISLHSSTDRTSRNLFKKLQTTYIKKPIKSKKQKIATSAFERFFNKDVKSEPTDNENFGEFFDVADLLS